MWYPRLIVLIPNLNFYLYVRGLWPNVFACGRGHKDLNVEFQMLLYSVVCTVESLSFLFISICI